MGKTGVGYILYIGVTVRGYGGKMPLGRTEHRRQAIFKMDLKKWGMNGLAQVRKLQGLTFHKTILNHWLS
jgi:hypothetical protein